MAADRIHLLGVKWQIIMTGSKARYVGACVGPRERESLLTTMQVLWRSSRVKTVAFCAWGPWLPKWIQMGVGGWETPARPLASPPHPCCFVFMLFFVSSADARAAGWLWAQTHFIWGSLPTGRMQRSNNAVGQRAAPTCKFQLNSRLLCISLFIFPSLDSLTFLLLFWLSVYLELVERLVYLASIHFELLMIPAAIASSPSLCFLNPTTPLIHPKLYFLFFTYCFTARG